jgi:pimeloyl-ACP methyl ester carboxylesterase
VAANKLLADNIPGAKLEVIQEVGHFYQLEKPAQFNAAVKQFIASLNLR